MGGHNERFIYIEMCIGAWIQRERLGIVEIELPCTLRGDECPVQFLSTPLTIDFLNELRKPSKKLDDGGNEVVDTERLVLPCRRACTLTGRCDGEVP
jgi:hypothetical protein